jgi:hypothetical protein
MNIGKELSQRHRGTEERGFNRISMETLCEPRASVREFPQRIQGKKKPRPLSAASNEGRVSGVNTDLLTHPLTRGEG